MAASCVHILAFLTLAFALARPYTAPFLFRLRSYPLDPVVGNVKKVDDAVLRERFIGKSALIVGGTRGIGRGIAIQLAKSGASVAVVGRSKPGGEAVVDRMKRASASKTEQYVSFSADLSTIKGVHALVELLQVQNMQFDYLVMTIGVWPDWENPNTPDGVNKVFATDVLCRFALIRSVSSVMKKNARVMNVLASTKKPSYVSESTIKDVVTGKLNEFSFGNMGQLMYSTVVSGDAMLQEAGERLPDYRFIGTHPGIIATELLDKTFPKWMLTSLFTITDFLGLTITEEECGRIHATILSSENVNKRKTSFFNHLLESRLTTDFAYNESFRLWLWTTLEETVTRLS